MKRKVTLLAAALILVIEGLHFHKGPFSKGVGFFGNAPFQKNIK